MPGISFIYDNKRRLEEQSTRIHSAINALCHNENFSKSDLIKRGNIYLAVTKYSDYPFKEIYQDKTTIFIEGKIYNKSFSEVKNSLLEIAKSLEDENEYPNKIGNWISETDGDYLIFILNDISNKLVIFNDFLGRLPFYYAHLNERIVISREIRFISKLSDERNYDITAIAESLLFGYPLGENTFIKNFVRVPPATLLEINLSSGLFNRLTLHDFNFGIKNNSGKDLLEYADNLEQLLTDSCISRLDKSAKNILSLSGGLDSRAIATSLKNTGAEFSAATYIGYKEFAEKDAIGAEEVAKKLDLDWSLIKVAAPRGDDINDLIKYKNGLNTLSSTFLLSFYKQMTRKFGADMIYITGDGGDKVFPDHRPSKRIKNVNDLLEYLISNKHFFTPKKIERLLGVKKHDLYDKIIALLQSYPEDSMDYKYERFIIMERGVKWLFEAEDRNRFYFWSVAPFYGLSFFNYSMNIPDEIKKGHKLYYKFLENLSPDILKIKNALWNVPVNPNDIRFQAFNIMKDKIYPLLSSGIKRRLRMMINKTALLNLNNIKPMNELIESLLENKILMEIFSANEIKKEKIMSKAEFYNLLTVLLSIDDIENSESILKRYSDIEFI